MELFDGYISYREEEIDTEDIENQYYGQWLPLIDNVVDEYDYYKNIACYKDYVAYHWNKQNFANKRNKTE